MFIFNSKGDPDVSELTALQLAAKLKATLQDEDLHEFLGGVPDINKKLQKKTTFDVEEYLRSDKRITTVNRENFIAFTAGAYYGLALAAKVASTKPDEPMTDKLMLATAKTQMRKLVTLFQHLEASTADWEDDHWLQNLLANTPPKNDVRIARGNRKGRKDTK
jgi:hypothetical protein